MEFKRPATKWDKRFIDLASYVAQWSKDPSTKCGAVVVRPDKTIASVGYNGFPKGCYDEFDMYANKELKYARVVHAEVNAILHAREPLIGYTMYTSPAGYGPTCDRCATCVIQSGIKGILHQFSTESFTHWRQAMERALDMYHEAGVGVVHLEL